MTKLRKVEISSAFLHMAAMAFMLADHLRAFFPDLQWLSWVGRLSFPLFAFLIAEGFFHTKNLKKYFLRMLVCALISEIPFNLYRCGDVFTTAKQNVLWCFLLCLVLMYVNETVRGRQPWVRLLVGLSTVLGGAYLCFRLRVDYNYVGVVTVMCFYFFRGRSLWSLLGQLAVLGCCFLKPDVGFSMEITCFGREFLFPVQGFGLLSLMFIWLYKGKKGLGGKVFRWVNYSFYPVHLLVFGLILVL